MRHKKLNKRFGRNYSQRKQLLRSLVRALFISHKIETTAEKAKQARRLAEKLITLGKKAGLSNIRAIDDVLQDKTLTKKVTKIISPLFANKSGGYTRIIKAGYRKGDGAAVAILELTEMPATEKKAPQQKKDKQKTDTAKEQRKIADERAVKKEQKQEALEISPKLVKGEPVKKQESVEKAKADKQEDIKHRRAEEKKGLFGKFKKFFK